MSTPFTQREREKLEIVKKTLQGNLTNEQAALMLGVSLRQVKRLKKKVREEGDLAIVHQLKGKASNHQLSAEVKEEALDLVEKQYADFKPTFAAEKLEEHHCLSVNPQTLRRWMSERGLWKIRKQKEVTYRSWRPRKEYFGELQQFDGSYHLWFESRYVDNTGVPIEVCLLASIDDATGEITRAKFTKNEGVVAVFAFWQEYVEERGKPLAIYLDKLSTYKINHKNAVDNQDLMTQFERVNRQLNIQLITAHSPEAKGRVERLFGTLQDRLVKEMRLAGITTPEEGNRFLKEVFLLAFNQRFAVAPAKEGNIHRALGEREKKNLSSIFSTHEIRRINLDFTIQFKNTWYQLTEIQPTTVRPLMKVIVETWLDGTVHLLLNEDELAFVVLPEKPKKQRIKQPLILTTHTLNYKPPPEHPWRKKTPP